MPCFLTLILFVFSRVHEIASLGWDEPPPEYVDVFDLGTSTRFEGIFAKSNFILHQRSCVNKNGRLAVIRNKKDDEKLKKKVNEKRHDYIMGLFTPKEDIYLWINGEKMSYHNWDYKQPDSKAQTCEFCGESYFKGSRFGWNDVPCESFKSGYAMCEMRSYTPDYVTGLVVQGVNDIEAGSILFHEKEKNLVEIRGAFFFRRINAQFLKAYILPDWKLCGSRKLPNDLAFKDISFNLGNFPYVYLSDSIFRMDILRYLPGTNISQITSQTLMILMPDNSIIGCFQIKHRRGNDFFLNHNKALQSFFWGRTSQKEIKKYQALCSRGKWYPRDRRVKNFE